MPCQTIVVTSFYLKYIHRMLVICIYTNVAVVETCCCIHLSHSSRTKATYRHCNGPHRQTKLQNP